MENTKFNPDSGISELILLRIRLYARRRIAWLRKLWSEEGETGGQLSITHAEIDAILDRRDSRNDEVTWYKTNPDLQTVSQEIERVEDKIKADHNTRFSRLITTFGLNETEINILQLCFALSLDPSLSRVFAYLNDHAGRGYVTEELAARLFGYQYACILRKDLPLVNWEMMIEKEGAHGEPAMLVCDPVIAQWLQGVDAIDAALARSARIIRDDIKPFSNWPVKEVSERIKRINSNGGPPVRVNISGSPGSGRHSFAALIASQFKMKLLALDSDYPEDWPHDYLCAQRLSLLNQYRIAWNGMKALEQPWPGLPHHALLQFLICDPDQKPKPAPGMVEISIEMPEQPLSVQKKLLKEHIPSAKTWGKEPTDTLISQRRLNIGDIITMKQRRVSTPEEVTESIRDSDRYKLGPLARLLECPFVWEDIVIQSFLRNALEDFEFEARARKKLWEQEDARNLFPQGRGLIGLFTGPPGTGKTMAAQVIAAELKLDLYRIDLSSVVSKYVGETSQNLERILSRAEHMDIVLLFDEADALFGKRTEVKDAHDRFANTDTNYLLQAIENYRGIAILASNKKENIDTAFIRRLRYVLEFPKPDARQREDIWLKILNKLLPDYNRQILNGQLKTLADNVELTGSQIKFALLSAYFIAKREKKPTEIGHLIKGMERELMKEGRTLSSREMEKILGNAG